MGKGVLPRPLPKRKNRRHSRYRSRQAATAQVMGADRQRARRKDKRACARFRVAALSKENGFLQLRRGIWEHVRDVRLFITGTLSSIYISSHSYPPTCF